MPNLLIRICDALFCVLLLCSAILAEGVEVSAGEQVAVGPLAVCFLIGPLNTQLDAAACSSCALRNGEQLSL